MSQEAFEQFREIVLKETPLQAQLRPARDITELTHLIVKLGRERGFDIEGRDVETMWRAAQRAWIERWI